VYDRRVDLPRRVASRQHAIVQRCRALASRRDTSAVLLDGEHLVDEALRAGVIIEAVLTDGRPRAVDAALEAAGVPWYEGTTSVLSAASPVRTPSGLIAIASWTPARMGDVFARASPVVIGMAGVQDPGNVGSVIRSAHALGATGVLALDGSADPSGWKALRGAMGSTFHVPVAIGNLADALHGARAKGITVAALVARDGTPLPKAGLKPPVLLLVGNEGHGLDERVLDLATTRVHLPMQAGVDSLNVAVSAALALWEIRREHAALP
jgi:TrmH family RNA methyltransferase